MRDIRSRCIQRVVEYHRECSGLYWLVLTREFAKISGASPSMSSTSDMTACSGAPATLSAAARSSTFHFKHEAGRILAERNRVGGREPR